VEPNEAKMEAAGTINKLFSNGMPTVHITITYCDGALNISGGSEGDALMSIEFQTKEHIPIKGGLR
jgi:hypothetical protein